MAKIFSKKLTCEIHIMSSREIVKKLQSHFDSLAQIVPGEEVEFWFARDLQEPLGYARWENFIPMTARKPSPSGLGGSAAPSF